MLGILKSILSFLTGGDVEASKRPASAKPSGNSHTEKVISAQEKAERARNIAREAQVKLVKNKCAKHLPTLQRKLETSLKYDDYGSLSSDGRFEEAEKFLDSMKLTIVGMSRKDAANLVIDTVQELQSKQEQEGFLTSDSPIDGLEFESWVASSLSRFGWQAQATVGTGDQGIDVVARLGDLTLGIQCKRYSKPVGNKAVQEAYAGATHMGLDHAAVLTNSDFTKSARELAASTGVMLLFPHDIPTLKSKFIEP